MSRSITFVAVLALIGVVFLVCFTKQRKELAAVRDQIEITKRAPQETATTEVRPVLSAIGSRAGVKQETPVEMPDVDMSRVLPKKERVAFLKEMRSLIRHSDSGMTSFIPSKDYSQKIHSMNAETLKVLLVDLEKFQTNWMDTSMMKGNLLNSLVQLDPRYVLDVAHEGGNQKWGYAMTTAIRMIARRDPDEAIGWIEGSKWEDVEWKYKLTSIYAQVVARDDLPHALETIQQFHIYRDEFKDALRRVAITVETPDQRQQISSYLSEVEDSEARDQTRATLVRGVLFREGFANAADAVAELFEEGDSDARNDMIQYVAVEALPDGQGSEIADWVLSESSDEARAANIEVFVGDWVKRDYDEAAAWIGEMEEGTERNAAIAALVEIMSPSDPNEAAVWAREIR